MKIVDLLGGKAEYYLNHTCKTIDKQLIHIPGPDMIDKVWMNSDRNGNERIEYSTKDSNKQRGKVVGDSCLAFKTSCFHNVYYKPTLFPGVVFI